MNKAVRLYVKVQREMNEHGQMTPVNIIRCDGHSITIARVCTVEYNMPSQFGRTADRYTIEMEGRTRRLFFEHESDKYKFGRWFLECQTPGRVRHQSLYQVMIMRIRRMKQQKNIELTARIGGILRQDCRRAG